MVRLVGIFLILGFTLSCNDEVQIKRLFTYPESNQLKKFKVQKDSTLETEPSLQELYISLVSNLSEQIYPQTELRSPQSPAMMPSTIKVGGLPILSRYLETLRNKIDQEKDIHLLSLAMGATLPETLTTRSSISSLDQKKIDILKMTLAHLKIDYHHMGYREALWTQSHSSDQKEGNSHSQWINSNIFDLKTGKPLVNDHSLSYAIKKVGDTAVGIIAVTSYDSLSDEQKNEMNGIYFQDPLTAVLRTRNILKSQNVHLNILMYHGEMNCPEFLYDTPIPLSEITKFNCDANKKKNELYQLLSKLPPKTIDLIITPSLKRTAGQILGTPLLGLPRPQSFIGLAKLVINDKEHEIDFSKSYILPPLKLCHEVFAGLEDCVLNASKEEVNERRFDFLENTAFGLIPSKFLGTQILPDPILEKFINGK